MIKKYFAGYFAGLLAITLSIPVSLAGEPDYNNSLIRENQITQPAKKASDLRWVYGISFGAYFAHASTANYYNGSGEHSIEVALNRIHNRERLLNGVNEIIENFEIGDLPQKMHYNPSMQIGFFGGMNFNRSFAVLAEFNYTRLSVADRFTIFTDKETFTSEPYRLLSDVYGSEERIELRVGFQYTLFTQSYFHPFIESGINITDTKVIENMVDVAGLEFNIREIRIDYYDVRDYGMGFGLYTSIGLNMEVGNSFSFRMGGSISLSQINLGDNNRISPQYTMFLRLNLNEILSRSQATY
jgi:hypothetical protein